MNVSYSLHRVRELSQTAFIKTVHRRCAGYSTIRASVQGKIGLEFGGASSIFSRNHLVPVYDIARSIDNCNYAQQNLWHTESSDRRFGRCLRKQLTMEATNLCDIADNSYDFILASHVLEHIANPLLALREWKRVLKPSGTLLVVLPHKTFTFDHRRPYTTFAHLKSDYDSMRTEADLTHLEEILALHDLKLDPRAGSLQQFRQRCLQNATHRAMHHHVFSPQLLTETFTFLRMEVISLSVEMPQHLIIQAKRASGSHTSL